MQKMLSFRLFLTKLVQFLISRQKEIQQHQTSNECVFKLSGNWQVSSALKSTRVAEVSLMCTVISVSGIPSLTSKRLVCKKRYLGNIAEENMATHPTVKLKYFNFDCDLKIICFWKCLKITLKN